jgi:hypothetical protein
MARCRYRREAASWQSNPDGKVCARATKLARMQASVSNSGSIFKYSAAPPVTESVSGRTRQNNSFGALRGTRPQFMAPVYQLVDQRVVHEHLRHIHARDASSR